MVYAEWIHHYEIRRKCTTCVLCIHGNIFDGVRSLARNTIIIYSLVWHWYVTCFNMFVLFWFDFSFALLASVIE